MNRRTRLISTPGLPPRIFNSVGGEDWSSVESFVNVQITVRFLNPGPDGAVQSAVSAMMRINGLKQYSFGGLKLKSETVSLFQRCDANCDGGVDVPRSRQMLILSLLILSEAASTRGRGERLKVKGVYLREESSLQPFCRENTFRESFQLQKSTKWNKNYVPQDPWRNKKCK